jgi:hypothetical protein
MNVYYLPSRSTESLDVAAAATHWPAFQAGGHQFWARVRLTAVDVWSAVRRGGGRNPIDDHVWFPDDVPPAPRRRTAGPARVLDFDAARRRRRLAAAASV